MAPKGVIKGTGGQRGTSDAGRRRSNHGEQTMRRRIDKMVEDYCDCGSTTDEYAGNDTSAQELVTHRAGDGNDVEVVSTTYDRPPWAIRPSRTVHRAQEDDAPD
jgi:hypothetical protein